MSPFECFQLYIALKNHFKTKTYDFFKYHGKTNASRTSFDKRRDKIFFEKLAKHTDCKGFLVSNLLENTSAWVRELAYSDKAEETYTNWLRRQQSLQYLYKQDLTKLREAFDDNILVKDNNHPHIVVLYLRKQIQLETLCIVCKLTNCLEYWEKHSEDDPIFEEVIQLVKKYTPFISIELDIFKKITLDNFSNVRYNKNVVNTSHVSC